jgi:sarcosine oxidase subunit alpha
VTPDDVGLSGLIAKGKPDFVGKRSLARPDLVALGRKQLVGLRTKDPKEVLDEGAQIVADSAAPIPMRMIGHVTSSYWSSNCGHSIALALIAGGRARRGHRLYATTPDGFAEVTVCDPVFVDASGGRANG